MTAIIFSTPRLHLRQMDMTDLDQLYAILSNPQVMRYYPAPYSRTRVQELISHRCIQSYAQHGYGLWAVLLRETGELIGDCGLLPQTVEGQPQLEIGYHIRPKHWNRGYASEAAAACRDYAFAVVGAAQVISLVDPLNAPSRRVAEKTHQHMRMCQWERVNKPMCMYYTQRAG